MLTSPTLTILAPKMWSQSELAYGEDLTPHPLQLKASFGQHLGSLSIYYFQNLVTVYLLTKKGKGLSKQQDDITNDKVAKDGQD